MKAFKKFLEGIEVEERKEKIKTSCANENRTEEADKISDLEQKIKVYAKWKELCYEITELEKDDVEKFTEFLETAVDSMKTIHKFSILMANDDLENAEKMIGEMQETRNNLVAKAIKFLGI